MKLSVKSYRDSQRTRIGAKPDLSFFVLSGNRTAIPIFLSPPNNRGGMKKPKGKVASWSLYESEKRKIQARNLPADEYERAIRELVKKLGI